MGVLFETVRTAERGWKYTTDQEDSPRKTSPDVRRRLHRPADAALLAFPLNPALCAGHFSIFSADRLLSHSSLFPQPHRRSRSVTILCRA